MSDEGGADASAERKPIFYRNTGYAFTTVLSLDAMYAKLNASSPWKWSRRENDTYDNYLSALANADFAVLRLTEEKKGEWTRSIEFKTERTNAEAEYDALARMIREEIVPGLEGTNVREVEAVARIGGARDEARDHGYRRDHELHACSSGRAR